MGSTIDPIPCIEIHSADCIDCIDYIDREDPSSVSFYLDMLSCYDETLMEVMGDKEQEQDEEVDLTRLSTYFKLILYLYLTNLHNDYHFI